jgi:dTDP-3-amino-3,4,6-trideoxy-alpha-D-glucose transaminase
VTPHAIPFLDLRPAADSADLRAAIDRVVGRGWFVLGPEVEAFEAEFAEASGVRHAVGVGSGTDALTLLLRAADIGPGDEVIVPALTAAFTGLAVLAAGARPVFADVDPERLTIDPGACAAAVTPRTRAIMPVHLYGQPADLASILAVAQRHALAVIEDCCQSHLATCADLPVGTQAFGGAFSFYPTKNLGALGDGGAVITNDRAIADRVRRLRNGGQASRYDHVEAGMNSRLDEIQAAVLRARLPRLAQWTADRRALARAYRDRLPPWLEPVPERDAGHVYHLFPVRSPRRDALQEHLRAAKIETLIHYPVPLPGLPAFASLSAREALPECPAAASAAAELLSLPLNPRLTGADIARVAATVAAFDTGRVLA